MTAIFTLHKPTRFQIIGNNDCADRSFDELLFHKVDAEMPLNGRLIWQGRPFDANNEIEAWVFDLDNTLTRCTIICSSRWKRNRLIQDALDVDRDRAYFRKKAICANSHQPCRADETPRHEADNFEFVHDIDVSVLTPDPALHDAIAPCPRKYFHQCTTRHAENVANRLGVMGLFEDVFDIVAANYIPKPNADIYPTMLERFNMY